MAAGSNMASSSRSSELTSGLTDSNQWATDGCRRMSSKVGRCPPAAALSRYLCACDASL